MSDRRLATEADLIRHLDGLLSGKPVKIDTPEPPPMRDWLFIKQLEMPNPSRAPSLAFLLSLVSKVTGVKQTELRSQRRDQTIVRARHIFFHAARNLTERSYPEIGRHLGGRDHTTVMHGVKKIKAKPEYFEPELSIVMEHCGERKEAA